ncbi:putative alpha-glucosidase [Seiridium cardinale]|uniref:alpha-glucosidase n=1 Tax=Seiridium cardinale TaxID=138064 RepID=A0ABR2X5U1_9PEZI
MVSILYSAWFFYLATDSAHELTKIAAQVTTSGPVTGSATDYPTPTLPSSVNYAPSVTPNVLSPSSPDAQQLCPGYKASNVANHDAGFTADLMLAGTPCNVYGNDIENLVLDVQYQNATRLNVRIYPKYLAPANNSQYILPDFLSPVGVIEPGSTIDRSDLILEWSNDPTFQFKVSRANGGEVLFDTFGTVIVYEDQFLELVTSMVPDYNIYGLPESIRPFRISNNYTQTFWNQYPVMNDQPLDANMHSVHPVYLETRYGNGSSKSHVVYGRNMHGQEWLMQQEKIIYRTLGGSFDFYFFSGSTVKEALAQQQLGVIRTPVMQPYWALGFHQVRWGYQNWSVLQDVIDNYAAANIQLEAIWNDLDYLLQYRDFQNDENTYPVAEGREFLARLHANGQYWMPILDPNIYAPDPTNETDAYAPYERGVALQAFIRDGQNGFYYGDQWPGYSVWPDFLIPQGQEFWTNEFLLFHEQLPFDGWWIDLTDLSSWCTGSCGTGNLELQPVHVPFKLPGEPGEVTYEYPEAFDITNATEAASASAAAASESAAFPSVSDESTPTIGFTFPTPGVRNISYPPYVLNNTLAGHSLEKSSVAPYATHSDEFNTTEYEMHNLFGIQSSNASYNGLLAVFPGKRPFLISRSTSPGSGNITGHWGGDTNSKWGNMYFTIAQALTFSIAGVPYFGVETCGFNGNTDMELCTRWMELSAFFPLYRNHNSRPGNTIGQEAYRWATTAEGTRRAMDVRFKLLPYIYSLFWKAHTSGETVMRALQWEFPDDESLKGVDNQFMLGPSILVTPVLEPLATAVKGVFPGIAQGTRWYDWYNYSEVDAQPGENKTIDAPLVHIPVFLRGGSIIASQKPGNTTKTTRMNPWSIIVALDNNNEASGSLYLDDGVSLVQDATKEIELSFLESTLSVTVIGDYLDTNPLASITIAGWKGDRNPSIATSIDGNNSDCSSVSVNLDSGTVYVQDLQDIFADGAWVTGYVVKFD